MSSMRSVLAAVGLVLCSGAGLAQQLSAPEKKIDFNLSSQPLGDALNRFAEQSGLRIVFYAQAARGMVSPPMTGTYTPEAALKILLTGSSLEYRFVGANTVEIHGADKRPATSTLPASAKESMRLVRTETENMALVNERADSSASANDKDKERSAGIPEIFVKGKRSLNADIQRTEDAPQPYVVFNSEEIQRSQAVNLEDFLRTRLPMNTASGSLAQVTGNANTRSSIDLRGLGENQTLILVDGRRMPGTAALGILVQPDLNGIPLAAIERIEVLPSTAGGIHGGSATGGVVNVIMRRDFRGLDAKATYANTFDTDAASIRLDASAGFSLESGRTQVMITATRSQANNLVIGDRDFAARAIALQLANNPGAITASTTPPLGATVNIISAQVIGGIRQPLVLDPAYGSTALGTTITHIPLGYAGPVSDNGAALVANAGRYNLDLPGGVLGRERGLVGAPSTESVLLNLRREFGERLEAFLDFSRLGNEGRSYSAINVPNVASNLPANAPNNPFQQAINVRFPTPGLSFEARSESATVRAAGGLIARLQRNWTAAVDYGWSRSRFSLISTGTAVDSVGTCVLGRGVAANVILGAPGPATPCAAGDSRPALNALQEGNTFPIDFTPYLLPAPNTFSGPHETILKDATVRVSGPVVNLPGGPLSLSALIERREEELQDAFTQNISATTRAPTYGFYPHRSQDADSYYLEVRAPLISPGKALPFMRELELQASVRRDEYKTRSDPSSFGISVPSREGPLPVLTYTTGRLDSTDYTLSLRYAPLEDLALRASFGTGFLPPSVSQIAPAQSTSTGNLGTDPKRGNTNMYVGVPFVFISGGSPDLQPEKSRSGSVGVIFTPRFASGFRLSIDYTRIAKTDEIQFPASQFLLDNEDVLPGRIVRGANLAGDLPGWAGPITSFNQTFINIARTTVEACDIQADYTLETERFGEFHWYAVTTRQLHSKNQLLPAAPVVDRVGFTGGPLEWRGNLGLDWDKGPWALSWNAQYYNSYLAYGALALPLTPAQATARGNSILNQGSPAIASQVYHDLIATYRFDAAMLFAGGFLAGSEISFGIQNLFDESPPILASTSTTSAGYSFYGDPRLRRYSVSLRKSFGGR